MAHDLYKRGLQASNAASEKGLRQALGFFQQAIDRDPKFALAHTGIAWVHVFLADAYDAPKGAYLKARTAGGAPYGLALTYARMGRDKDAREIMRRMDERARTRYVPFVLPLALGMRKRQVVGLRFEVRRS